MGVIEISSAQQPLQTNHLIGRSRSAHTTIASRDVSAQHLSLSWDGQGWRARDLASRNGTRIDGVRLKPGEDRPLRCGAELLVGSPQVRIVLVDDAPPAIIAQSGEAIRWGDDSLLALPSEEHPEVVVVRDPLQGWLSFVNDSSQPTEDGATLSAGGQDWTLTLPELLPVTADVRSVSTEQGAVGLAFRVSADEEYVEVTVRSSRTVTLKPRSHHYLLLTLARIRMEAAGEDEAEQGWVHREDLRHMLRISANQLYVSIHRLRKEAEKSGLFGVTELIEQRKTARQVRIGVADLHIQRA